MNSKDNIHNTKNLQALAVNQRHKKTQLTKKSKEASGSPRLGKERRDRSQ